MENLRLCKALCDESTFYVDNDTRDNECMLVCTIRSNFSSCMIVVIKNVISFLQRMEL